MSTNRKTIRTQLGTLLEAELVGAGLPLQALYPYRVADFNNQSPVGVLSSGGSDRTRKSLEGAGAIFYFEFFVFVLYATLDGTWTEQNAEDALDDIEAALAQFLVDYYSTAHWVSLRLVDRSEIVDLNIGGQEYKRENFTLAVEVF